jgi:tRNA (guanine-N7-)-methyltransferase
MGKGKLKKWAENKTFSHVFEPDLKMIVAGDTFMRGQWNTEVFGNSNPIVLELGCGKGEYTVGLARLFPEKNFIGVDIKGHRFWRGAKTSNEEGLENVAFLRTRIEFIQQYFGPDEIDEIWLTFSDPQPRDEEGKKRLSSPHFIKRYQTFTKAGSTVHLKTDNTMLYEWTLEQLKENSFDIIQSTDDVYGSFISSVDPPLDEILAIRTYYEQKFSETGEIIKYLSFKI